MLAEHLNPVLAGRDNSYIFTAIGYIANAIGMTKIAEETVLS